MNREQQQEQAWSKDPDDWPYTPPLEVYRRLVQLDPNLFWRMGSGHALNLLEDAIDRLDQAEKLAKRWRNPTCGRHTSGRFCSECTVTPEDLEKALAGEGDG